MYSHVPRNGLSSRDQKNAPFNPKPTILVRNLMRFYLERIPLTLFLLSLDLIGANDVMPVLAVFQLSGLSPLNVNACIAFSARKAFV